MPDETTSFERLLADLAGAEVDFVTIGGVACALCGFVRSTEDVDILVRRGAANLASMLRVLEGFGEGHARELSADDFTDEEGSIRVVEDFPVDVFVRLRGFTLEDLLPHRVWHDAAGTRIPYLDAEGLIRLKEESDREKDRIDVVALRRILGERK